MSAPRTRRRLIRTVGRMVLLTTAATAFLAGAWLFRAHVLEASPEILELTWEGRRIDLLEPRALGVLLLLPLVAAMQAWSLSDLPLFQRGLNFALRALLIASITAALARPSISSFDSSLCVVYLVDVSESVPDRSLERARDLVQAGWSARRDNLVRLVVFAERPAVVPLAPGTIEVPPIARMADPSRGLASDPAAALRLSYGLCPQDHIRRVVLVTDGNENRGNLLAEAATAHDFGVRVDTWEIPFAAPPDVMIRGVEIPPNVRLSEPFRMTVDIHSTTETDVSVSLRQNEFHDIRGEEFHLTEGINRIELTAEVYEPGFRRFEVSVSSTGDDRFPDNNSFTRTVTVEGRPRVLYVEGESRSRSYLERALDRERNDLANFDLDVRGAYGFPNSLEEMANFDLIILSDVEAQYVSRTAMANVERYVRELGGGLLLAGGERAFGPGGWDNTPIEDISPVTFDMQRQRELPSLALMLVIDRSGSMDGVKLEMAKDAARAAVDMLGPQDYVGVIAFDDTPQLVVRLQQSSNRARIRSDIGRIGTGGGTDIHPALQEAFIQLIEQPARLKHVILLTDGQAPWDGISDTTTAMRSEGITVSSVAVGREADRALLEMIAELGGGRFYATNDPNSVPQIFVQETAQVARTNLVEEPFRARPVRRAQATSGIDWSSSPWLLGYVTTQARPRAEMLLETERGAPLLARWRVGLGRVAVWTSDLKNRWAVEWVRNRIYPQFWAQLVRDMMRAETGEVLAMDAQVLGGEARVVVDAIDRSDRFINGLTSTLEVTDPAGERSQLTLEQVAAGRYEGAFGLTQYGSYLLRADHALDGDTVAVSFGSVTWPYPDEYLTTGPEFGLARRVAALTGGRVDPAADEIWDDEGLEVEFRRELWSYALFAALCLLVLDLLLRRTRMFGGTAVSWSEVTKG